MLMILVRDSGVYRNAYRSVHTDVYEGCTILLDVNL